MKNTFFLNKLFGKFGFRVVRETPYQQAILELSKLSTSLYNETRNGYLFNFIKIVKDHAKVLNMITSSKSQLFQDLFVIEKLNWKTNGYFVEFGATNGKDLSNTYLLEKDFAWDGILVEPGKNWHNELRANRNVYISTKCVWGSSGEMIKFNQTKYPEFSTIESLSDFDGMASSRVSQDQYFVETISLQALLENANAPKYIDYISIDTEGSEYEILRAFNFSHYKFGILTIEHNHNQNESKIDELLSRNGYNRVHREISNFDGWYLNESV
jgi:FkbM family methyltransferase